MSDPTDQYGRARQGLESLDPRMASALPTPSTVGAPPDPEGAPCQPSVKARRAVTPRKALRMGRIFRRGTTCWVAYHHGGKEYRESARSTKESEARALLKQRLGEAQTLGFVAGDERKVRFEALAEGYVRSLAIRKLRAPETAGYRVANLRRFLGTERAIDLTPDRLTAYQVFRLDEGASGATVNRELAVLHRMFVLAVKARRLSRVPPFPDPVEENQARQGFAEYGDYRAVRERLPEDYQDVLDFGYWSGWRKNKEVQRLPWSMVDLGANVLRLSPDFSKSKDGRVIPIPAPLREVLLRRLAKRRLDTPYVFHVDGHPVGDWKRTWKRATREAGVKLLFHDLRRTAVRNLDRAGVPRHVAMQMVGHKTEAIYRRYNIVNERDLHEAGEKLTRYVAALAEAEAVAPSPRASGLPTASRRARLNQARRAETRTKSGQTLVSEGLGRAGSA